MYLTYYSEKPCISCDGTKLRTESRHVKISGKSIVDISQMSIREAYDFAENLKLSGNKQIIGEELIKEIKARLQFMLNGGIAGKRIIS